MKTGVRGREGRGGRVVIEAASRNKETQFTIAPPPTTTIPTISNLTVAVAATGRDPDFVPARNSVELETIMQNAVVYNSRNQYNTRCV